ncbi:hypothetical protein IP92_02412 [Pseudoduganella flava]|uniref:Uncharacterized protein n=1 Tax=Pseudoduganella flava TaxID=871742 RepID=A0A562PSK2_9BURK|nr:hypothetical protein IP92_02412 [Pseudoduganella flava]
MFQSPSFTHRLHHRLRTTAQCLWPYVAPQRTLSGRGYRFELSISPGFLQVLAAPGFPLQPCRVTTASEAILCGMRYALSIRPTGRAFTDFRTQPGHRDISFPAPFHGRPTSAGESPAGLGRKRELHPPAPIAAAPAPLRARGYSVCLVPGWRPGTCRGGAPTCPFGRVCLQLAVRSVNPLRRLTERTAVHASHAGFRRAHSLADICFHIPV